MPICSTTPHRTCIRDAADPAVEYRAGFLRAIAYLGLAPGLAQQLAEQLTGRPFAACGAAELQPVLDALHALLRRQRVPSPRGGPRATPH